MRKFIGFAVVALTAAPVRAQGTSDEAPQYADPRLPTGDPDFNTFYQALSPYGVWMETTDYGNVWRPSGMDADWRPYSHGRWEWTAYGWTWVGEEPYSWAVDHYGRWVQVEGVGWSWVPDYTWGPAWVSFRESPEYIGWTPIPPGYAYTDLWYGGAIDYAAWSFLCYSTFYGGYGLGGYSVYSSLYTPYVVQNTIWAYTHPATAVVADGAVTYGPNPNRVQAQSGREVRAAQIHVVSNLSARPSLAANVIMVVAPPFHGPRPMSSGGQMIGIASLLGARATPPSAPSGVAHLEHPGRTQPVMAPPRPPAQQPSPTAFGYHPPPGGNPAAAPSGYTPPAEQAPGQPLHVSGYPTTEAYQSQFHPPGAHVGSTAQPAYGHPVAAPSAPAPVAQPVYGHPVAMPAAPVSHPTYVGHPVAAPSHSGKR